MDASWIIEGPTDEKVFIFAHGAGAPMDSDFMNGVATGLVEKGIGVVRFEFPYMQERRASGKRRPPNRMPVLEEAYRAVIEVVRDEVDGVLFAGGKSMGGRVASRIADEVGVTGVVCLGYPFHPPRKPEKLRTAHLAMIETPTLIVQGTRDKFGVPDEVASYDLAETVELQWVDDGDHSLVPRKRSGRTPEENLAGAVEGAAAFIERLV